MTDIKVQKTIYEDLQDVRNILLNNSELKKSGRGNTGKRDYSYFELADFLPAATKLFAERGMCPVFSINYDQSGVEMATLKIVRGTEIIPFQMPTAEAAISPNPIQNQGGKITYLRRYMYMIALDLVENDIVDASDNSQSVTVEEKKATPKQIEMIRGLYDTENVQKMLEYYHIDSLEELPLKTASDLIQRKRK